MDTINLSLEQAQELVSRVLSTHLEESDDQTESLYNLYTGIDHICLPLGKPLGLCTTVEETLEWGKEWFGLSNVKELLEMDENIQNA